jgi:hypothetical protein
MMGDRSRQRSGGVITTQNPQDSRSQIVLEKTRAQFWACGFDNPEPEQSENYQLNEVGEPNPLR